MSRYQSELILIRFFDSFSASNIQAIQLHLLIARDRTVLTNPKTNITFADNTYFCFILFGFYYIFSARRYQFPIFNVIKFFCVIILLLKYNIFIVVYSPKYHYHFIVYLFYYHITHTLHRKFIQFCMHFTSLHIRPTFHTKRSIR